MPDFGLSALLATGLTEAGLGAGFAEAAAPAIVGGLEGAGLGAGSTLFTGGDPLTGALTGGLTGGAVGGLGPIVGEATGIGTTAADTLVGAAAGAAGQGLVGGDPLTGALGGAGSGLVAGAFGGSGSSTAPSTAVTPVAAGSGGPSAASTTAGIAPAGGAPVDLTAGGSIGLNAADPVFSEFGGFQQGPSVGFAGGGTGNFSGGGAATGGTVGGDIGSKIMGLVEKNPGVLLGAGVLGANMLMGDKPLPGEQAIQRSAEEAASQGRTLSAYQQSGTLPAGLQSVVDRQFEAGKAALIDQYSRMGLGNSTMIQDKLNALRAQKSAEVAQFADMLAKQGIQWTQLSNTEFNQLLAAQTAKEEAFGKALGSFAAGLSGLRTGSSAAA